MTIACLLRNTIEATCRPTRYFFAACQWNGLLAAARAPFELGRLPFQIPIEHNFQRGV